MEEKQLPRREFLAQTLRVAGAPAFLTLPFTHSSAKPGAAYTVGQIIDLILQSIPGAPFDNTVDTLKSGSMEQPVTGIVTTMFPTMNVLEEAVRLNANFIIAHEPSFYNHQDNRQWVANNTVVNEKYDWLTNNHITIWRFHDGWHAHRPDGIFYGVLQKAGWLPFNKEANAVFTIPAQTLEQIAKHLKKTLGISRLRLIGDLQQQCSKIAFIPGAAGGEEQVSAVEKEHPDLLIVGEVQEWETPEYIRDARKLKRKTALLILGHSVSEEPGMEYLQQWLKPRLPDLKITHIASGDPFTWL